MKRPSFGTELAALCLALLLLSGSARAQTAQQLSDSFAKVAEWVLPSVVSIDAVTVVPGYQFPRRHPFLDLGPEVFSVPERQIPSVGSGVIVRSDGYIVTNYHVVKGVTKIRVTLSDEDSLEAKLVGYDPASDLAVLKVVRAGLPAARWGDSEKLRIGEWVLAFGSPFHMKGSVTHGIISGMGRQGLGIADYENFIQTDASINPGNSGGALVNLQGQLVGINTAILSPSGGSDGVSLAIPSSVARPLIDEIISTGRVARSWLGVFTQPVTHRSARHLGLPQARGVLVVGGYKSGPAGRSGMERLDVILKYNGKPVANEQQLRSLVASTPVGSKVAVDVWRDRRLLNLTVTTENRGVDSQGRPQRGI